MLEEAIRRAGSEAELLKHDCHHRCISAAAFLQCDRARQAQGRSHVGHRIIGQASRRHDDAAIRSRLFHFFASSF